MGSDNHASSRLGTGEYGERPPLVVRTQGLGRLRPRRFALVGGIGAVILLLVGTPRLSFVEIASGLGTGQTAPVTEKRAAGQTFVPSADGLTSVAIFPGPGADRTTELIFHIRDEKTQEVLVTRRGPASSFARSGPESLEFSFPPLIAVTGRTLSFTVAVGATVVPSSLSLRYDGDRRSYPGGDRLVNGKVTAGDLGFTVWRRGGFWESWRTRLLSGHAGVWFAGITLATLLALLAVELRDRIRKGRWHPRAAVLASLSLALLATLPVFARLADWAADESDWPEVVAHLAATKAAVRAAELPGWTPAICGGAPLLANPQPFFLAFGLPLTFLVGEVAASKLAIPLGLAAGLLGMFFLTSTLEVRGLPALAAAVVFMFSGFLATHLANGQLLWLTMAWVPWILASFLRSIHGSTWWVLLAASLLVLIFVEGRVYLVAYVALFLVLLGILRSFQDRDSRPIRHVVLIGALTVGLSAWKLLPTLTFLADAQTSLPDTPGLPLAALNEAFLRRDSTPNVEDTFGHTTLPRHEYAAYVGLLPLLLIPASLHRATRRQAVPFLFTGLAFLTLATLGGNASPLEHVPLFRELRNPPRMVSLVTLAIALLAGWGMKNLPLLAQQLGLPRRLAVLAPLLCALLIVGDLLALQSTSLARLFRFPAFTAYFVDAGFFQTRLPERQPTNGYPTIAAGKGAKDFCPPVLRAYLPTSPVRAREDAAYRGEIFAEDAARLDLREFRPNTIALRIETGQDTTVTVNQNADRGWSAATFPIVSKRGLLAVRVPAGHYDVRLTYRPPYVFLGTALSLGTIAALITFRWRQRTHALRLPARRNDGGEDLTGSH